MTDRRRDEKKNNVGAKDALIYVLSMREEVFWNTQVPETLMSGWAAGPSQRRLSSCSSLCARTHTKGGERFLLIGKSVRTNTGKAVEVCPQTLKRSCLFLANHVPRSPVSRRSPAATASHQLPLLLAEWSKLSELASPMQGHARPSRCRPLVGGREGM